MPANDPSGHDPRHVTAPRSAVRSFLDEQVRDIAPAVRLANVLDGPPEHYTLQVQLRSGKRKALILARRLVDAAMSRLTALSALRSVLRADLVSRGAGTLVSSSTRFLAYAAMQGRCAVCAQGITPEDRLVVRGARIMHAPCAAPAPKGLRDAAAGGSS
jgi:hypothetical protein